MKTEKGNEALTPSLLVKLNGKPISGDSTTFDGPIQIGAMSSRSRNGCVRVVMDNVPYTVTPNKDNAQQFELLPEIGGVLAKRGLSWGCMAFSNAIESGSIRYA